MANRKATTKRTPKGKADTDADLDAFAHDLAEVLRISRTHPALTATLYNGIAEAWSEFQSELPGGLTRFTESEEYVRLALAAESGEGGEYTP